MLWVLLWLACDDNAEQVGGLGVTPWPNNGGGGGPVVGDTWADVQTVLESNCYTCHGAGSTIGNLDLETLGCDGIVNGAASGSLGILIAPGDREASVIYNKVADNRISGPVMPPSGKIASASIETLGAWIDAGASCSDGQSQATTYTLADVQAVFDKRCTSGCHEADGISPELDLTDAYAALIADGAGVPSQYPAASVLVDPGHPERSFLMRKIAGYPFPEDGSLGSPMPLGGDRLPTSEIATIFGWILDGAKNP